MPTIAETVQAARRSARVTHLPVALKVGGRAIFIEPDRILGDRACVTALDRPSEPMCSRHALDGAGSLRRMGWKLAARHRLLMAAEARPGHRFPS